MISRKPNTLHRFFRALATSAIALTLSACAVMQPSKPADVNHASDLSRWKASGKLGVVTTNEAKAINFSWDESPENAELHLYGALGFGSVRILRNGQGFTLINKDGEQYANSANVLLQQSTGWSLPVEELNFWIRGVSAPGTEVTARRVDKLGSLTFLEQQGWAIDYRSYYDFDGLRLPERIVARRPGIKLTLAIKDWQFPAP